MGHPSPVELGRGKGPRAGGGRLEAPSGQGSLLYMKCLPRTRGGDSPSRRLPGPPVTHHPGSALLEIFAVRRKVCLSFPTAIKVPRRPLRQGCGVTESPGLRPRLPRRSGGRAAACPSPGPSPGLCEPGPRAQLAAPAAPVPAPRAAWWPLRALHAPARAGIAALVPCAGVSAARSPSCIADPESFCEKKI